MASKLDIARQYVLDNYHGGADFRWDLLSRKLQIKEMGGDAQERWVECDTRKINSIACDCATETQANITDREIRLVLNSENIPSINPLRDYLYSLDEYNPEENKGISWIDWLSGQVRVKDRGVEEERSREVGNAQEWWAYCFKKWFVAMVAAWMFDEVVNQEVLVLIGRQGIYKTTWLEHLLPPCLRAYGTKMSNPRDLNKDEKLRMVEYGIIFIDEIDAIAPRDINPLKSAITTTSVDERAAYAYAKEKRVRVASFCGSGNNPQFLTDDTGNRRWLPFEVESIENPFNWNPAVFPYAQIYGEAVYLARHGFNYWFDLDDIEKIEDHNQEHMQPNNEEQLLPVYFSPANPGDAGAVFMSASEISAILRNYGNISNPMSVSTLGNLLRMKGFVPKKSHGRQGYVLLVNQDIDTQRKRNARDAED